MTITKPMVLALDDEPGILRLLKLELTTQGFSVITADTGASALWMLETQHPHIALLDVVVPGMSGVDVMHQMRERSNIPVILLTARATISDKVRGLDLGADDYISKPFSLAELTARVRAVLRRTRAARDAKPAIQLDGVEIDLDRRLVKRGDCQLTLTYTEWKLLELLASKAGKLVLTRRLLAEVWEPKFWDDRRYLRVWISRLRRKLGDDPVHPRLIRTVRGVGYMLDDGTSVDDDGADVPGESTAGLGIRPAR